MRMETTNIGKQEEKHFRLIQLKTHKIKQIVEQIGKKKEIMIKWMEKCMMWDPNVDKFPQTSGVRV